ncbi:MAG TPA: L-threonylcarbamoyladenylate synthase [Nitrososphaerales archaeon]|nr:L-threonylcarbamoyladenylate synthase [Nitrososphaerales archaeon]
MTLTLYCDSDLEAPSKEIIAGKVIIFPTDTVYGLGTNPWSAEGVRACYSLKKREGTKKMPVLVNSLLTAKLFTKFGKISEALASKFWPGKLSIILPVVDPKLPTELVGNDRTLAVRMPQHECSLRLISACGGSLIGTSANISGEPPFTDPFDPRLAEFSKSAEFFLSGSCGDPSGVSSTIIDATDEKKIRIVREGALSSLEVLDYLEKMSKTDNS